MDARVPVGCSLRCPGRRASPDGGTARLSPMQHGGIDQRVRAANAAIRDHARRAHEWTECDRAEYARLVGDYMAAVRERDAATTFVAAA